ncbi:C-type lectin domain family 4 member C isoform 1 [Silurus asotus]|uniref:C-type lectin domain family 4 member C isoform 1 n=1 Tax=Silurus asotus TaxID=30991 RepID=A0AAD5FKG6_SILAS|nr:C-type lectin domain family 4 member C isoform 1 [Silurus asotus]
MDGNVEMKELTLSEVHEIEYEEKDEMKDVYKRVRLYKRISALFTILSIVLLAVVFALAMKLTEVQSIQKCQKTFPVKQIDDLNCSRQLCQAMYPSVQAAQHHVYRCGQCEPGWIKFQNSCYFKSKERLNWQESREACQKQDGDLAVIYSEDVQKFLSENEGLLYWIGLRFVDKKTWKWTDDRQLTKSYWAAGQPNLDSQGYCTLLRGRAAHMSNWYTNYCEAISQYICQKN